MTRMQIFTFTYTIFYCDILIRPKGKTISASTWRCQSQKVSKHAFRHFQSSGELAEYCELRSRSKRCCYKSEKEEMFKSIQSVFDMCLIVYATCLATLQLTELCAMSSETGIASYVLTSVISKQTSNLSKKSPFE